MPRYKIAVCAILAAILLTAFVLVPPVAAEEQTQSADTTFNDVIVDIAYNMITDGSLRNLVILDVRDQYEYNMGHLYDAILIPLDELEERISELEEHRNYEMIVYCKSGYRSQIACEILVEYGFIKVYNMLGGILAWIDADYPIYATSHHVTVNIVNEEILLQIEPMILLQTGCESCAQDQTCPNGNQLANIQFTTLEHEEDHTVTLLTYEVNGVTFGVTITKTLLWSYSEFTDEASRKASFISTQITAEDLSTQFYSLSYMVQHIEYNLTTHTILEPLNSEAYNSSFTTMNYVPAEDSEVTSFEFIEFNASVTLSQQYTILGKVAKKIGKVYEKNEDQTVATLAQGYYTMKKEAEHLAKHLKQLQEYNKEIVYSFALLADPPVFENGGGGGGGPECTISCWINSFIGCLGWLPDFELACLAGCVLAAVVCAPFFAVCVAACFAFCGIIGDITMTICAISALVYCCL